LCPSVSECSGESLRVWRFPEHHPAADRQRDTAEAHPVEPNPPIPRSVVPTSSVSTISGAAKRANTSCAILVPRGTGTGSLPAFQRITFSSPR
jgi:hypothetical protein